MLVLWQLRCTVGTLHESDSLDCNFSPLAMECGHDVGSHPCSATANARRATATASLWCVILVALLAVLLVVLWVGLLVVLHCLPPPSLQLQHRRRSMRSPL
jgi:hypothetical protein